MPRTDVVVIGGGQAGLAVSHCLASRGIAHVVLERGRIGERWRSERWDSLRLLTPNWMTRLPGRPYDGPDPDGFMTMAEVVRFLEDYGRAAPVETGVTVHAVTRGEDGRYRVATDGETWLSWAVVVATGHCDVPQVPALAQGLPEDILQLTPSTYRNAAQVPEGGVVVVGASASGVQLAEELAAAGRRVTLSVGRHIRLPRTWRGQDILWWLDRMGTLTEPAHAVPDLARARAQPSLQLVGRPDRRSLDLGVLRRRGVRLAGRTAAAGGGRLVFHDDLAATMADAQRRLDRLLDGIDAFVGNAAPREPRPERLSPGRAPLAIDLKGERIGAIVWATGYRRDYRWLRVPGVLDAAGEIIHDGGVTPVPGLVVLGLRFLRHRSSSFIGGVGTDAEALAAHLSRHVAQVRRRVAA